MSPPPRDTRTLDLFEDWKPPAVTPAPFAPQVTAAASLRGRLCRAMGQALKESGKTRDAIAADMGAFLGEKVSKTALDAMVSEAKSDHSMSVERFVALVQATQDMRLLALVAEQFGMAVVPTRYLPAIEETMLTDKIEELEQRKKSARRRWKGA